MEVNLVSVVICTYNRMDILPKCIAAISRQNKNGFEYEIVLVDNNSTDGTDEFIATVKQHTQAPRIVYVKECRQGLSFARNAGITASSGDIIHYIDDDAIADPDLLNRTVDVFRQKENVGCVGGKILLQLPPKTPYWYSERFDGYFSKYDLGGDSPVMIIEEWQLPYGANFSFSRSAIQSIGCFNVGLGRIGKDFSGGEDHEACMRLIHAGLDVYYQPNARVYHVIPPSRLTWKHVAKSAKAAARSWVYFERSIIGRNRGFGSDLKLLCVAIARVFLPYPRGLKDRIFCWSQFLFYFHKIRSKLTP